MNTINHYSKYWWIYYKYYNHHHYSWSNEYGI